LETKGWAKAAKKEVGFDLNRAKETFMEAKIFFVEAYRLGIQEKLATNNEA